MLTSIRKTLPSPRRFAGYAVRIVGVSVLIGTFLFHIWTGLGQLPVRWPQFLWNVYFSFIYTGFIATSIRATMNALEAHVPLRSRRAVALHVGVLSVAMVMAYGLATVFCRTLHPSSFSVRGRLLVVTAAVAFVVTIVWSAFGYMRIFYRKLREAEAAQYEARLSALRAQINPHFLFNAFNSIAALVRSRPEEAETVVEDLSDLFRYALQASTDSGIATLGEEVEAIRRYLNVEKARYRDRLIVEIDVPEALRSVPVPSMTLQPLVENAVKHGVGNTQEACTVTVTAQRTGDALVLRVTDTGPGFDTTDLDVVLEEGSGLTNVRERLRLFFDDAAQMHLRAQGVELWIPLDAEEEATPAAASAIVEPG